MPAAGRASRPSNSNGTTAMVGRSKAIAAGCRWESPTGTLSFRDNVAEGLSP
jgi:hypothetical protein